MAKNKKKGRVMKFPGNKTVLYKYVILTQFFDEEKNVIRERVYPGRNQSTVLGYLMSIGRGNDVVGEIRNIRDALLDGGIWISADEKLHIHLARIMRPVAVPETNATFVFEMGTDAKVRFAYAFSYPWEAENSIVQTVEDVHGDEFDPKYVRATVHEGDWDSYHKDKRIHLNYKIRKAFEFTERPCVEVE
jgi:hypothetical protein